MIKVFITVMRFVTSGIQKALIFYSSEVLPDSKKMELLFEIRLTTLSQKTLCNLLASSQSCKNRSCRLTLIVYTLFTHTCTHCLHDSYANQSQSCDTKFLTHTEAIVFNENLLLIVSGC